MTQYDEDNSDYYDDETAEELEQLLDRADAEEAGELNFDNDDFEDESEIDDDPQPDNEDYDEAEDFDDLADPED